MLDVFKCIMVAVRPPSSQWFVNIIVNTVIKTISGSVCGIFSLIIVSITKTIERNPLWLTGSVKWLYLFVRLYVHGVDVLSHWELMKNFRVGQHSVLRHMIITRTQGQPRPTLR